MFGSFGLRVTAVVAFSSLLVASIAGAQSPANARQPRNLLANPSFEYGVDGWRLDRAGDTAARFVVDQKEAAAGQSSALVTIDKVDQWGTQFGQTIDAGTQGKTYTFAAMAKSDAGPVAVRLEIERAGNPWDRAARSSEVTLKKDAWTEIHVTFKVEKPFPEGWFAYVSCTQPGARYRLDAVRLVEGGYVPLETAAHEEMHAAGVSLFDTGSPAPAPLAGDWLAKRAGWTQVPEDQTEHSFKGDAVFLNDRLAVVLRRGARGAEVFSRSGDGFHARAVLAPLPGRPELRLQSVKIVENAPGAVAADALFRTAGGNRLVMRYALPMGQLFVRTEARDGVKALHLEAPCRFVVLPDFFADDIVADATEIPVAEADLPSENFLLHLLGEGDAIVMSVSNAREQDARVTLSGQGAQRTIQSSEIPFGKDGKIWVAVMAGSGVWHVRDVVRDERGKVVRLDWTTPYPAQWRVDWRRTDGLTSSWEMITERPGGDFEKPGWFGSPSTVPHDRKRWTTVLGSFEYPCWVDRAGQGHLQPLARVLRFQGPAVIYPINRAKATPLTEFTVVDVVRATLGVGPCEYILDVEGQGQTLKGRATCATRDALGAIYANRQQKQKRPEVLRILNEVLVFVKHIRGRIEDYVAFGHEILGYLDQQKKAHPELAEPIGELERLTRGIDAAVDKRREHIQTPEYVAGLTQEFRDTLLDYEKDDALAKCKAITEAIVVVGGNQDELVGECRLAVKILRQRAGLAMAIDPRLAEVAKEIRVRTQKILRNAASYEAPRQ
jgi:hypothetical protein